jgi:hypothetical protein
VSRTRQYKPSLAYSSLLLRAQKNQNSHQVLNEYWLPPRDSNPDMLIQSQLSCR